MRTELGVIQKATFGFGGYDDAMIGFGVTLGSAGWGVGDFTGSWSFPPSDHAKWTVADQDAEFAKATRLLGETLKLAKRRHVQELVGTPVEVTLDGNKLVSWRVLTEVVA